MNTMSAYAADMKGNNNKIIRIFNFDGRQKFILENKKVNPEAIFDHLGYLIHVSRHPVKHSYVQVNERLNQIKTSLLKIYSNSVDPVQYLAHLYFEGGFSIRDISKKLADMGVEYPPRSINVLFKDIFGWKLRPHNEGTKISEKKIKARKTAVRINEKRTEKIQAQTSEFVNNVLDQNIPILSSEEIDYYKSRDNIVDKIVFIMTKYKLAQDKETTKQHFVIMESIGQSNRTMAKHVQIMFDEVFSKNKIDQTKPTIKCDHILAIAKGYKMK